MRQSKMKRWRRWLLVALPIVLLGAIYFRRHWAVVTYRVGRKAGGSYVTIRYSETPMFRSVQHWRTRVIRIPANQLPWSTTVLLPYESYAVLKVDNEPGKKSVLSTLMKVNGRVVIERNAKRDANILKVASTGKVLWLTNYPTFNPFGWDPHELPPGA